MNRILTRAIAIVALLLAFCVAAAATLVVVALISDKNDIAQERKEDLQQPAMQTAAIDQTPTPPVAPREEARESETPHLDMHVQLSPLQKPAVSFTEFSDTPMFGMMQEGSAASDMFPLLKNTIAQSLKEPQPVFQDLFAVGDRKVTSNQYAAVFCGHVNAKNSGKQTFVVIPAANLIALGSKANEPYNRLCAGSHADPG